MGPEDFPSYRKLKEMRPISLENEVQAFRQFLITCQISLKNFDTTVAEDDALLKEKDLPRRKAFAVL
eukprot:CAMPEP_0198245314 /NCGR_PEP_ID=MMETSP1446-20131203/40320_1 /TAXON_ID=1461542 ORGANISM="Unidentified sp, Strain CCMP2111" /NCGR_SAMPLE_ID=MMETSP1446 /ASSEMBLY_ACC=CAM_ASM_001112 /LENGTH=66 /DNA_ID=CAMNT_0043929475 /DNA_START=180 /DNA_END=376 /DNA_ORIENTATION=-